MRSHEVGTTHCRLSTAARLLPAHTTARCRGHSAPAACPLPPAYSAEGGGALKWKRHPAALWGIQNAARYARCEVRMSGCREVMRSHEVGTTHCRLSTAARLLPAHTTARCRGHSAPAACQLPTAACELRRRRRGPEVEAASCRFVRKGTGDAERGTQDGCFFDVPLTSPVAWSEREASASAAAEWGRGTRDAGRDRGRGVHHRGREEREEGRPRREVRMSGCREVMRSHEVGTPHCRLSTAARLLPAHTTARCRGHSAPAACPLPPAYSAEGGGALKWKRHPAALCVKGGRGTGDAGRVLVRCSFDKPGGMVGARSFSKRGGGMGTGNAERGTGPGTRCSPQRPRRARRGPPAA
jgi:hypothetical protein